MVAQLTDAQLSELDRAAGQSLQVEDPRNQARYMLIPEETYEQFKRFLVPARLAKGSDSVQWNDAKNDQRCDLIDKEIDGTLTIEEALELAVLQEEMLRYRQRVAPLPLEGTRELHRELMRKAAEAEGQVG